MLLVRGTTKPLAFLHSHCGVSEVMGTGAGDVHGFGLARLLSLKVPLALQLPHSRISCGFFCAGVLYAT